MDEDQRPFDLAPLLGGPGSPLLPLWHPEIQAGKKAVRYLPAQSASSQDPPGTRYGRLCYGAPFPVHGSQAGRH